MTREALIIFIKNPELGKVKTRLAATVGDVKALEIYQILQGHTKNVTSSLPHDKWLFYSSEVDNNDSWDNDIYHKNVQSGDDFGQRMLNAFQHCFDLGYKKVCIIGSDLMEISGTIIQKAFDHLDGHDVIIGPAMDGGYYLLGMKALHRSLFHQKQWSTEDVLKDTIADITLNHLTYTTLELLNDIDTELDWQDYLNTQ